MHLSANLIYFYVLVYITDNLSNLWWWWWQKKTWIQTVKWKVNRKRHLWSNWMYLKWSQHQVGFNPIQWQKKKHQWMPTYRRQLETEWFIYLLKRFFFSKYKTKYNIELSCDQRCRTISKLQLNSCIQKHVKVLFILWTVWIRMFCNSYNSQNMFCFHVDSLKFPFFSKRFLYFRESSKSVQ